MSNYFGYLPNALNNTQLLFSTFKPTEIGHILKTPHTNYPELFCNEKVRVHICFKIIYLT